MFIMNKITSLKTLYLREYRKLVSHMNKSNCLWLVVGEIDALRGRVARRSLLQLGPDVHDADDT